MDECVNGDINVKGEKQNETVEEPYYCTHGNLLDVVVEICELQFLRQSVRLLEVHGGTLEREETM